MQVFLETEQLLLRRFTRDDVDNLVELDSDPDVMRFINGGYPTPREMIQNRTLPRILRYYEPFTGFGFWAAIEKSTGEFLGWFHFRPAKADDYLSKPFTGAGLDEVELGYRLRKAAWGKGYATEGSRALIRKGFTELGVQRVIAFAYKDNIGSWRVMEKAGMKLVRTYRLTPAQMKALREYEYQGTSDDIWDGDDVEYALQKSEWEQQEAARLTAGQSSG